jgi:PIN domain nuclease of toxin-antitoxin system
LRILLDTHILLWWLADDPSLSKKAKLLISDEKNFVFVSVASGWEITIKKALGKLEAPDNLEEVLKENCFKDLPITLQHVLATGQLPMHHHDPFDRILVAQAKCESLTLLTADKKIMLYDVPHVPVSENMLRSLSS